MIEMIQDRDRQLRELKKALSLRRYSKPIEDLTDKERYSLELVFKEIYRIRQK